MLKSSSYIAEQALRQIGVLSPLDTAALPEEFDVALDRLALLIDELIETEQLQFFLPANQTFTLEANKTTSYNLNGILDVPLVFVTQVFLVFPGTGRKTEIKQLRRNVFDLETYEPDRKGLPKFCYVENKFAPTIQFYPTIPQEGYQIELSGFRQSADITLEEGRTTHGFPAGWQRGLIYLLAADIGSGPVKTIPLNERRQFAATGEAKLRRLQARQNKEQVQRPNITKARLF